MSPSRFDFALPTKTLPCVTCGQPLVADLNAPEPIRCALCKVLREAVAEDLFRAPSPSATGRSVPSRKPKRQAA